MNLTREEKIALLREAHQVMAEEAGKAASALMDKAKATELMMMSRHLAREAQDFDQPQMQQIFSAAACAAISAHMVNVLESQLKEVGDDFIDKLPPGYFVLLQNELERA